MDNTVDPRLLGVIIEKSERSRAFNSLNYWENRTGIIKESDLRALDGGLLALYLNSERGSLIRRDVIAKVLSFNTRVISRMAASRTGNATRSLDSAPLRSELLLEGDDHEKMLDRLTKYTAGLCYNLMVSDGLLVSALSDDYVYWLQDQENNRPLRESVNKKEYETDIDLGTASKRGGYRIKYVSTILRDNQGKPFVPLRESNKFRTNRYGLYRSSIPSEELDDEVLSRVGVHVIWDTDPDRKGIETRISAISLWKLYDKHEVYGKHAYLEMVCSRVEYMGGVIPKKLELLSDLTDDSIEKLSFTVSSKLVEARTRSKTKKTEDDDSKKKKKKKKDEESDEEIPEDEQPDTAPPGTPGKTDKIEGLGRICMLAMMLNSYHLGYKRIVLSVVHETAFTSKTDWPVRKDRQKRPDQATEAGSTIELYKRMGFVIIQDKLEKGYALNDKDSDTESQQYVMVKIMTDQDFVKSIEDISRFASVDDALETRRGLN